MTPSDIHARAYAKANEIETELKTLRCWDDSPLSLDKFENMGAFGCNTMSFVQWLQFVLIPRVRQIAMDKGTFPSGSMLGTVAIREFDGDSDKDRLWQRLYELDELVNESVQQEDEVPVPVYDGAPETLRSGDNIIPPVVYTLISVLPKFKGDELEGQLQSYDTFLDTLDSSVRPVISDLLMGAAVLTTDPAARERIERASASVRQGGRAAEPYNHEETMRKFMEDRRKSFPNSQ